MVDGNSSTSSCGGDTYTWRLKLSICENSSPGKPARKCDTGDASFKPKLLIADSRVSLGMFGETFDSTILFAGLISLLIDTS